MFLQLCLFVLASAVLPGLNNAQTRIVGGQISDSFIRYQVAIYSNGNFICGGALINDNCVITAAQCVQGRSVSGLKIRAGIRKLSTTGGGTRNVTQSYIPSTYDPATLHYDVAILKLVSPFNGTYIAPIALNNAVLNVGDSLKASGWGLQKEGGIALSDQLRYVFLPAVGRNVCISQYPGKITSTMFCAGPVAGGKGTCYGDTGGPVVKDNKLYAIISWRKGCAQANKPDVFTAVKQVLPWIQQAKANHCI